LFSEHPDVTVVLDPHSGLGPNSQDKRALGTLIDAGPTIHTAIEDFGYAINHVNGIVRTGIYAHAAANALVFQDT
jgi:hypothetical protein